MVFRTLIAVVLSCLVVVPSADADNDQDIIETAISSGNFETLVSAVQAAELVETLKGEGPFTVFAPSDEAFSKLPDDTLTELLKPQNRAKLTSILTYHVVPGRVLAGEAVELPRAASVNGQYVDITYLRSSNPERIPSQLYVDDAAVTQADIMASNGIIHVIDTVLMPESKNLVETAQAAGQFQTLLAAAKAAGLANTLTGGEPLTVLAPTDEAFERLPEGTVEALLKPENKEKLRAILTYHVLPGRVFSTQVLERDTAKTVQGEKVYVSTRGESVFVNDAQVIRTDIAASNGVIHIIDQVLQPGSMSSRQAVQMLREAIHTGVPKFNSGDHRGCAEVYRRTCERVIEMAGDDVPGNAVTALRSGVNRASHMHGASEEAWALRHAMDRALELMRGHMRMSAE